jgi:TonB family protein
MFGIRHNIVISIMLHSMMFAAAFIAGSSSELRGKRLIAVSLIEEWKTGIAGKRREAPMQQQRPQRSSGKAVSFKPHVRRITPTDMRGRKEKVISTPEAEIKPSLPAVSDAAISVNGTVNLPGIPDAEQNTSPVGSGTGFGTQGLTRGSATATSVSTESGQQQGSPGDASLRQKIRDALQANLVYPYIARQRRMEGSVLIGFRINRTGNTEAIRILKSSGYSMLDTAAKETVVKASPFPVLNNTIEIPITFLLKDIQ